MMGHEASDDLDSSDDEDHFPPSQVFINNDGAKNNMAAQASGNNGKVNNAKAAKFDQLLKVSQCASRFSSTYKTLLF